MIKPEDAIRKIHDYYKTIDGSTSIQNGTGMFKIDNKAIADIEMLFAANAVYDRDGLEDGSFKTRKSIGDFFAKKRSLIGGHNVRSGDISAQPGIDPKIADQFKRHFPTLDPAQCLTVKATGAFTGAQCFTDENRFVTMASGMRAPFDDYWVFHNDKVHYRSSFIETPHAAPSLGRQ
jgi:hypothetical protein